MDFIVRKLDINDPKVLELPETHFLHLFSFKTPIL